MQAIEACRTEVLGGHMDVCVDCGHASPSYNSCRNRHCPKCQFLAQARWLEQRRERILPVHYFHVVFTLPSELRPLVLWNRRRLFTLLFRSASNSLLMLGLDPARLGALLGLTAVLHTWTRDLRFHPHLHCIVTGGGLSPDGEQWIDTGPNYLFPAKVLGALFRGKFLDAVMRAYERGEIDLLEARQPDDAPSEENDETSSTEGWRELFKRLTGIDLEVCPACGGRRMQRLPLSWLRELDEPPMRGPPRVSV